jgi:serine/threonine-protein kinase
MYYPTYQSAAYDDWQTGLDLSRPSLGRKSPGELVGSVVGSFLIERHLDSGGMADVYVGIHRILGKRAAIKLLRPELAVGADIRQRFLQEATILDRIDHPNVVDIFDVGVTPDGRLYLAMELLDGETLRARMDVGQLPILEALSVLRQVCSGLEAAHALGIFHRDLKPENLFLCQRDGETVVKLLDWGIARIEDDHRSPALTREGIVVGTPFYIAPEQATGRLVDGRADVYALGAIAYEMLLGDVPFPGDSAFEVICRHVGELPAPPREHWPEIPPLLEHLLLGMLEKDPDARPTLVDVVAYLDYVGAELRHQLGVPREIGIRAEGSTPRLYARDLFEQAEADDPRVTWVEIALEPGDDDADISVVISASELRAMHARRDAALTAAYVVDELFAEELDPWQRAVATPLG